MVDSTKDPLVTTIMLTTAQECVEGMDASLKELKEKFNNTSQEAKEKLKQKKLSISASGSRTSHKYVLGDLLERRPAAKRKAANFGER